MSNPSHAEAPSNLDSGLRLTRRRFLEALASASAGLVVGAPSFAAAATSTSLQIQVLDLVRRLRSEGMIGANEPSSWSVYDFTAGRQLVSVNEDLPRQAASMIKPFVAQAFFFQADDNPGRVRYTPEVRGIMERMIRNSNNNATNQLIDLVSRNASGRGPGDVESVLKSHAPDLFQQTRIVEKIPAGGKTYRNRASARDYNRFLCALWQGKLPYSRELRSLMALPNHDRIVERVAAIPESVRVYDKTGSTAQLCGNMGIIEAPSWGGRSVPYTFVGIIERPGGAAKSYGAWITARSNAMRQVSSLVYLYMKDRYQLV